MGAILEMLVEDSNLAQKDFEMANLLAVAAAELFGLLVLILCNVVGIRYSQICMLHTEIQIFFFLVNMHKNSFPTVI